MPVGVVAPVLVIWGIKKNNKGMSIVGMVLGIICLGLTIINGAIGVYQGQETNIFTLRDSNGEILMTGGISSVGISTVDNGFGVKEYAVEIMFDKNASEEFARITEDNIGKQIGVYLNDEMISNPTVVSVITGGSCQILVNTYNEAEKLSDGLEKCE